MDIVVGVVAGTDGESVKEWGRQRASRRE